MLTATIEVAYVNAPKPGKKTGSVKTTNDEIYGVWPNDLQRFQPGNTYTVQYEERNFNGQIYKTIKFPKGAAGTTTTTKAQAPVNHANTKSVEMFVMGIIGRSLQGTGNLPALAELTEWIKTARLAWEKGFTDGPAQAKDDFYNDDIPF